MIRSAIALASALLLATKPAPAIVGGQVIPAANFTFFASLRNAVGDSAFCSASVIGDYWVLTAKHCTEDVRVPKVFYIATGYQNTKRRIFGTHAYVDRKILLAGDVVLLRTMTRVTSGTVMAVPLLDVAPNGVGVSPGDPATVLGWGRTGYKPDSPRTIVARQISLVFTTYATSEQHRNPPPNVVSIFGKDMPHDIGPTHGDSGGPVLIQDSNGAWQQVGVNSQESRLNSGIRVGRVTLTSGFYTDVNKAMRPPKTEL